MSDTKAIIDLFIQKNKDENDEDDNDQDDEDENVIAKREYMKNIMKYAPEIWNKFFDMTHRIFRLKHYKFDYNISTDGCGASLRFIHENYIDAQINEKQQKGKACKKAKEQYKGLNEDEIQKIKDDKEEKKKDKQSQKNMEKKKKKQ